VSTAPPIEPGPAGFPANRGYWKRALLGCGVAAILLIAALVAVGVYVQKKPAALTDLVMERVRDSYASDVTEQEKADLDGAYSDFRRALEERRVTRGDIDRVRDAIRLGEEVTRDRVRELTTIFRTAAARGAPASVSPASRAPATPVP